MKRKYVALMLGVTLAFSSMTVYAEEPAEAVAMETAGEMEVTEEEDAFYGEITEIGEDSITIAWGTMIMDAQAEEPEEDAQAENVELNAEVQTDDAQLQEDSNEEPVLVEDPEQGEFGVSVFELTGEDEIVPITEDTVFYKEVVQPALSEQPEGQEEIYSEEDSAEEKTEDADGKTSMDENDGELMMDISEIQEIQLEEISFEDLLAGDIVRLVLDEEGNAETVTVIMTETEVTDEEGMLEETPAEEDLVMTLEEVETEAAIAEE